MQARYTLHHSSKYFSSFDSVCPSPQLRVATAAAAEDDHTTTSKLSSCIYIISLWRIDFHHVGLSSQLSVWCCRWDTNSYHFQCSAATATTTTTVCSLGIFIPATNSPTIQQASSFHLSNANAASSTSAASTTAEHGLEFVSQTLAARRHAQCHPQCVAPSDGQPRPQLRAGRRCVASGPGQGILGDH